ncbi:hypothetical protein BDQ94DRAFT_70022 [Aspergillus welwitschiae]|uniref:Uncharacterized protein n=1 Tax=Aspergillus welwitschiae TaxID=1341132 RepID=A0A3F3QEW3_9EURO|nr:hypothetical protein BDQ94DRAFT_70022 [Aspergillus welwitschiae]RDH37798.1 hypothetical protein BDQ94DRAFT_70022 [Aspergillus welwitschiae]
MPRIERNFSAVRGKGRTYRLAVSDNGIFLLSERVPVSAVKINPETWPRMAITRRACSQLRHSGPQCLSPSL